MKGRILLIDDDELLLGFMDEHLSMNGYETRAFQSPLDAIEHLEKEPADLVITDVKMNEMTGDEVLSHVLSNYPDAGVILITGFGNINHSVNALRKGAYDYITKPFKSNELIHRVEHFFNPETRVLTKRHSVGATGQRQPAENRAEPLSSPNPQEGNEGSLQFIGQDPHIRKLLRLLPKMARSDAPVLIQGESGSGKEVFAHQIYQKSLRSDKPYIKINCANLPSELVESTLFGHIKGAFTGAISDKKGAFDEADGGTLLLDEITEIDINVQAKLLRVLQEKEFYRVGSQKPVRADVRILATTNRNIADAISDDSFREDLYYRLNVFPISIPPLRERKSDIPLLARHFVDRYTARYNMESKTLSPEVETYFEQSEWRGNVRELDNKVHRGVILSHTETVITLEHIENNMFSNVDEEITRDVLTNLPLMSIEDMELQLIKKTLEHTRGNQKKAAEILGISDRTIRNKLKNAETETVEQTTRY